MPLASAMFSLRATTVVLVAGAMSMASAGPDMTASAGTIQARATASEDVSVQSVEKVYTSPGVSAYLVSYSIDFAADLVHIEGLGTVPGKGAYHHLVRGAELTFRNAEGKEVLRRIPLVETVSVAARPPLNEVPPDDAFPAGYRSFAWPSSKSLQQKANVVLGRYFNYLPHADDKVTYISTTYAPLPLADELGRKGVVAQVALLLSFPHEPTADKYMVRIHILTKERRGPSADVRVTTDEALLRAASKFVDDLVAELGR